MSRYEFKLPDIGEGVTEGEVVAWHVKTGDVVKEDQPIVDVMTDKASVTITSPKAGRIAELNGKPGEIVKVHSVLVVFDLSGGAAAAPAATAEAPKKEQGPAATAVGDIKESLPGMGTTTGTATPAALGASGATGGGGPAAAGARASAGARAPQPSPASARHARRRPCPRPRSPAPATPA